MFKFISFVLVVAFMMVLGGNSLLAAKAKPPLSGERIAGEVLAGGLGGFAGGLLGAITTGGCTGDTFGRFPTVEAYIMSIGYLLGSILGSAYGVYAIGSTDNETGSFLATLAASSVGLIPGFFPDFPKSILTSVFPGDRVDWETGKISGGLNYWFLLGPPIGATIGFNLTRRYKSSSTVRPVPIRLDLVRVRF